MQTLVYNEIIVVLRHVRCCWWIIESQFAESSVKDVIIESENGSQIQEVHCSISSNVSDNPHAREVADAMDEVTISTLSSSTMQDNVKDKVLEGDSVPSTDKHSLSIEVKFWYLRFENCAVNNKPQYHVHSCNCFDHTSSEYIFSVGPSPCYYAISLD